MILLAFALLQAGPDARAAEVVVIGERLKTWRASWRTRDGKTTCLTKRSSGDPAVDAIGCAALTECGGQFAPRAIALAKDKASDKAARERVGDALNADLGKCMIDRRDAGIIALAEQRAAARSGS